MSRLQLNKSSLANESKSLETFRRFLPSLDLKRQQLMAERNKAKRLLEQTQLQIKQLHQSVGDSLPMLANHEIDLTDLVTIDAIDLDQENIVGTLLPVLIHVKFRLKPYSLLTMPHWVDNVVEALQEMLKLKVSLHINQQRFTILVKAVQTITQRVNLFEKVLIPQTQANIKRIKIFLSDEQMASVVRSKIAKRKRQLAVSS